MTTGFKVLLLFWFAVGLTILFFSNVKEGFDLLENAAHGIFYRENPCGSYDTCRSCAAAAGCGWCSDKKRCAPMGQDGFPIRYETDTGARVPICAPFGFILEARKCFD